MRNTPGAADHRVTYPPFFEHIKSLGFNPKTVIDVGVATGTPPLYEAFPDAYFVLFEPTAEFEPNLHQITQKYNIMGNTTKSDCPILIELKNF